MSQNDLRHRAELGELWYDRTREKMLNADIDWEEDGRTLTTFDLWTIARGDLRAVSDKLADLHGMPSPADIARMSAELPVPLGPGNFTDALAKSLRDMPWAGDQDAPPQMIEYAADTMRSLLTISARDLIIREEPAQLMVMDDRLAQSVIRSSNDELDANDLRHSPFPRCVIEFSRPVLVSICGRAVGCIAVGFHCDAESDILCAHLYFRMGQFYHVFSTGWHSWIHTGSLDPEVLKAVGIEPTEETVREAGAECSRAARNLWDFATSRNVSYEFLNRKQNRATWLQGRYVHSQGQHAVVRQVGFLGVDRTITIPYEREGKQRPPERHEWAFRVEVPGAFHKWLYCAACGDTHRRDLIGFPCRACGKQVGPRANIEVRKYWHGPHTRGPREAPVKDLVRELGKKKRKR